MTHRPPGPRGLPLLGSLLDFAGAPLSFLTDMAQSYGDVVYFRFLNNDTYMFCHPDDIEAILVKHAQRVKKDRFTHDLSRALGDGLVTSEGELWRRQRKLAAAAFTPAKIRGYADIMVSAASAALAPLGVESQINLHAEMSRVTLDVVGKTLFHADVDRDARTVASSMEVFNDFFADSVEAVLRLPKSVPTPRNLALNRAVRRIDEVLYRIIAERRRTGERHDDLLSAMLSAQDDSGAGMSDRQLRDECVTLFLAGHETTALALTHAVYLLSTHPEVEGRVRAELDQVLGGRPPRYEDVAQLQLCERVMKESLRLFPPVWAIGREVVNELTIGGYVLAPGAQIVLPQWVVHRDPRFFPDPEAFDPDRWLTLRDLPRSAYFPFGGGPRVCIGNHFAMLEAILLLALLLQRFHFELLPGERLDFRPSVTLRPKGAGLRARLKPPERHARAHAA